MLGRNGWIAYHRGSKFPGRDGRKREIWKRRARNFDTNCERHRSGDGVGCLVVTGGSGRFRSVVLESHIRLAGLVRGRGPDQCW